MTMALRQQRQHFYWVNIYRGVVLLFVLWIMMAFPPPHVHGVLLTAGFVALYTGILVGVGRTTKKWRYFQIVLGMALVLDALAWGVMLLQFSTTTQTDAPALLPALSFEGLLYWDVLGGFLGLGLSELLLLYLWFYQHTVTHMAFTTQALVFWMGLNALVTWLPIQGSIKVKRRFATRYVPIRQVRPHNDSSNQTPTVSPSIDETGNLDTISSITELTQREQEIYNLLKANYSLMDIATSCQIEYTTVKTHVRNIYRKLRVSGRRELP
ncbi:regulatory protein LuxR [Sulfobacillus acidophilus DSM 10332]|uniref:Regulatory protein LuxR n=1 Tax=Sulfobacillus acidophilus (strain ATCC 700253 / DSM 10332 / NAL) TaxID=679936 RepID=G8TZF1_SULAD|nr:regulatory protein LuxR [Sulfobacillus acidophilus DSM 10332]